MASGFGIQRPSSGSTSFPTTTKGDLIVHNGVDNVRLPVGSDDQVLIADAAQAGGVKWGNLAGSGDMTKSVYDPNDDGIIAVAQGGTGSATATDARTALGLAIGTNVQAYHANLDSWSAIAPADKEDAITTLAIEKGGTGSGTAADARTALGLAIGTNVQAYAANLTSWAAIAPSAKEDAITTLAINKGGTGAGTAADAFAALKQNATDAATGVIQLAGDLSGAATAPTVVAASESAAGKVELATTAEINTGTDNGRAISPDALAGSYVATKTLIATAYDYEVDTATGDGKAYLPVPSGYNGMNLVSVMAHVITAGTTGTLDVQVANVTQACDMLTTKLTIDSGETSSLTAATPAVIDPNNDDVATGDLLRIDVDAIHTTPAKGLIVTLEFRLP